MTTEAWEKKIGLADMYGTVADISFDPPDDEFGGHASLVLTTGGASLRCSPTPEAWRQLAAAALDAADALEASEAA